METKQTLITLLALMCASSVNAADLGFEYSGEDAFFRCVDLYDRNVSTNHPRIFSQYPFTVKPDTNNVSRIDWRAESRPSESDFLTADPQRGRALYEQARRGTDWSNADKWTDREKVLARIAWRQENEIRALHREISGKPTPRDVTWAQFKARIEQEL